MRLMVLVPPAMEARLRAAANAREEALTTWIREAIRQRLEREATGV
jgi:predicted HicB family RNase H-like nuclease